MSWPWVPKRKPHQDREHNPFYDTREWRADRRAHLAANPLCVKCLDEGRYTMSTVSDHIIPMNLGGDPWNWDNRQALCSKCHDKKSATDKAK